MQFGCQNSVQINAFKLTAINQQISRFYGYLLDWRNVFQIAFKNLYFYIMNTVFDVFLIRISTMFEIWFDCTGNGINKCYMNNK